MNKIILRVVIPALARRTWFLICRCVHWFLQWFHYELCGINTRRRQINHHDNYKTSAEILAIRARNRFCPTDMITLSDFILSHEGFTAPEYVLTKDSISLFFLDENNVVFCDSKDKDPLWKMRYGDFFHYSAYANSVQLIVMPIGSFLRLAESVDLPSGKVVFVSNSARCGSTLLAHMFDKTNICSVFSEPEAFNSLARFIHRGILQTEYKKLIEATIKLQCKPMTGNVPEAYVIKITGGNSSIAKTIKAYFPQGKYLFIYRNMPDSVRSMLAMITVLPSMYITGMIGGNNNIFDLLIGNRLLCPHNPHHIKYSGLEESATWLWMHVVQYYLSGDVHEFTPAYRYEDIISNPQAVLFDMFSLIGLRHEYVEAALSALKVHSQENSPIAANNLTKSAASQDAIVKTCEKMLQVAGLPSLSECAVLPGTRCVQTSL